ncbi:MAG: hypothetical protein ABL966_10915 [Acidimicrobiales bacterium]
MTDLAAPPDPARRRPGRIVLTGGLLVAVVAVAIVVAVSRSDDDPVATAGGPVPSPLFDAVEELTPTSLPEGWARCSGGPSTRADATELWWAQTFGPAVDGACDALITVTQVPPDDQVDMPDLTDDGKVGGQDDDPDAITWADAEAGSLGLYTWARGQGLLLEACCGAAAEEHFDAMAVAALDGTRERTLARCPKPESDLDREDEVDNFFGSRDRMFDRDDCPLRRDIATMSTLGPHDHCWPNLTYLVIGTPVGTSSTDGGARTYYRDPEGLLGSSEPPNPNLDLDAELPATAVDTGYHQGDRMLWIDEADDSRVYLVSDDHVEAWPLDLEQHGCA